MSDQHLPTGFLAAGTNAGIKSSKPDCGVLVSERNAVWVAHLTTNRLRAAPVERLAELRQLGGVARAVLAVSGNANAMTGTAGRAADARIAEKLAEELSVPAESVLTCATGVVGFQLPVDKVEAAISQNVESLTADPTKFSRSILTTDRATKIEATDLFIGGTRIRLHAVVKGSGMIAPSLATMLAFITTDAAITRDALQASLASAIEDSFNLLTVDEEMSTNDAVIVLANAAADNEVIEEGTEASAAFAAALRELCVAMARRIAQDGEGATRSFDVTIRGAPTSEVARAYARAVAGSMLVKTAVFGGDPNVAGRIAATLGAAAARAGQSLDAGDLEVRLGDLALLSEGLRAETISMKELRRRLAEPELSFSANVGRGAAEATAFGCDLSYDYVKINADYAAITRTSQEGAVAVDERLAELGPTIKKKLLIEALRYIDRFRGMRAVVLFPRAAARTEHLLSQFAEDILLLNTVGLRPIVVVPSRTDAIPTLHDQVVACFNASGSRAVGLHGADGGLIRVTSAGLVVSPSLLELLERDGYVPVVAANAVDESGQILSAPAAAVSARVAIACGARKLIYPIESGGVRIAEAVVSEMTADQLHAHVESGAPSEEEQGTLNSALAALAGGVERVHLVDGRIAHNIIAELFTDRGVGTLIKRS